MFKKIISIAMALVVIIGCATSVSAVCISEDKRPGIVGMEHFETMKKIDEAYKNGEVEIPYSVEMIRMEGYWMVCLSGYDTDKGYTAVGLYDHAPTDEEFDILWANRMTETEMESLMRENGFYGEGS